MATDVAPWGRFVTFSGICMTLAAMGYLILCVRTTAYQWAVYLGIRLGMLNVSRWLHPLDESFLRNIPNLRYWDYIEWGLCDPIKRDLSLGQEFIDLCGQDDPKKMIDFARPLTHAHAKVRHAMTHWLPLTFEDNQVDFLKIWATRMSLDNLILVHDALQDERLRAVVYEEIDRRSVLDIFDM